METFYAYAAGLFDGEGSLVKRGKLGAFWLEISNTHKPTLDEIQETFGYGRVEIQCRQGSPIRSTKGYVHRHDVWRWRVSRFQNISDFITKILPYVRIKREAVERVVEFLKSHPGVRLYHKYSVETKTKALTLLQEGHSYREVVKMLDVSMGCLWRWTKMMRNTIGTGLSSVRER